MRILVLNLDHEHEIATIRSKPRQGRSHIGRDAAIKVRQEFPLRASRTMSDQPRKGLVDAGMQAAAEALGGQVGGGMAKLLTSAGKVVYLRIADLVGSDNDTPSGLDSESAYIPYAIVGMGRCGSHVTIELAKLAYPGHFRAPVGGGVGAFLGSLFRGRKGSSVVPPKPMLIIGDIDEMGLRDFDSTKEDSGELQIKTLDYSPVATGGVGNMPMLSEFYTRGLLNLRCKQGQLARWEDARTHLVRMVRAKRRPRLVFYVAGAGGGTGSGAAPEVLRTQRWELARINAQAGVFFMGVAVLPEWLTGPLDNRRKINSGRFIIRYLAELHIDPGQDSSSAPRYLFRHHAEMGSDKQPMRPWDCLMLVSNNVMAAGSAVNTPIAQAQQNANVYIAQQVFSLAASQLRAEESAKKDAEGDAQSPPAPRADITSNVNYRSIRLDPNDLLSALSGVCSVAFASLPTSELADPQKVCLALLRLVAPPHIGSAGGLVEGISLMPGDVREYQKQYEKARADIEQCKDAKSPEQARAILLGHAKALAKFELFSQCPRVVFVINSPSDRPDPSVEVLNEVVAFLNALLPGAGDSRHAVVKQSQSAVTLSVFMEGSAVLAPDVLSCMRNYLKLVWAPRLRDMPRAEFDKHWEALTNGESAPSLDTLKNLIGESERYENEIANYAVQMQAAERSFASWVKDHADDDTKELSSGATVAACGLSVDEVLAAIRFIRYIRRYRPAITV